MKWTKASLKWRRRIPEVEKTGDGKGGGDAKSHGDAKSRHAEDALWINTIRDVRTRREVEEAYRKLMEKYWQVVTVLAAGKLGDVREAEDVAQEAFVRAFRSLNRLKEPTAFLGWLLCIARNLATDHLRSRKNTLSLDVLGESAEQFLAPSSKETLRESQTDVHDNVERDEEIEEILDAVRSLPDRYREVITLKYLRNMDGRTMAEHLGEPEGTIRNRLFRALTKLREITQPKAKS